jgi:PAS domain S-box-containing protein
MKRVEKKTTAEKAGAHKRSIVHPVIRPKQMPDDLYRMIVEAAPSAIIVCDGKGRLLVANHKVAELFGYPDQETLLSSVDNAFALLKTTEKDRLALDLKQASEHGPKENVLYRLQRKDSTEFFAEISFSTFVSDLEGNSDFIAEIRDVTDSMLAREALQQSEKKYRTLTEAAQDFIFIIDRDDRVCYVNQYGANYLGLPVDRIIGQDRSMLFPPEISQRQKTALDQVFNLGKSIYSETPVSFAENCMWLGTWLVPLRDDQDQVYQVLGLARDITARINFELQSRKVQERYRDIINRSLDGFFFADRDGRITSVNHALERILGRSKDQIIGNDCMSHVPESWAPIGRRLFGRVMGGHDLPVTEIRVPHESGRSIWIAFNGRRVIQDGHVVGVEGFVRDITRIKKTMAALEKSKASYQALFDSIPYEVFSLSVQGRLREANRIFLQNWGQVIGRSLAQVPADESIRAVYRNLVKKVIEKNEPMQGIFNLVRNDENVFYSTMISPILTPAGKLIGLVGLNINTTQQIQSFSRLRQLSARLVHVQEEERSHLSREIHDSLGQYLTALQLEIGAVSTELMHSDEDVLKIFENAKFTIDEAIRVSRSLVQLLRTPVLDDFGLKAAVIDFIEEFQKKWQITVLFRPLNMDYPLPREIATTLYRIIQESLTNVLKHAQTNRVEIRLKRTNSAITLAIRDYGLGFDKNKLGQDKKEHFGLFSMQERIELLGGRFRILSRPHEGVLVVAMIPLASGGRL